MLIQCVEGYLDDKHEFYDYRTGEAVATQIFDTSTTGMSGYNDLLPGNSGNKYAREVKNLKGEIRFLTPTEYYQECAFNIFHTTVNSLITQRRADQKTLDKLNQVLDVYHKQFPITVLNYADGQQEGLHRMMVAGDKFGWDVKFPVLCIFWFDEERHKAEEEAASKEEIRTKIDNAVKEALTYKLHSLDEFFDELQFTLNREFIDITSDEDVDFTYEVKNNKVYITCQGVTESFDLEDLKFSLEEEDEDDFDIDWNDIDIEDLDMNDIDSVLKKIQNK